jgi:hypothetical protein
MSVVYFSILALLIMIVMTIRQVTILESKLYKLEQQINLYFEVDDTE